MLIFTVYFFTVDFISLVLVTALLHFFWCAALPLVEALTFAHLRDTNNSYGRVRVWGSIGFVVAVFGVGVWLNHQPIASLLAITWLILGLMLLAAWRLKEVATPHFVQSGNRFPLVTWCDRRSLGIHLHAAHCRSSKTQARVDAVPGASGVTVFDYWMVH